eukprot:1160356-Pelagomonas_calceolata.AAC.8
MEAAEGTTDTLACRFWTVSFTVIRRPFQSLVVSLAISSPIFLGDRPRGPILGAREEAAPTSPPVTRTNTSAICSEGQGSYRVALSRLHEGCGELEWAVGMQ